MPSKVIIIVIEFMFLGINIFWALLRAYFNPRLTARTKMSLSRAQNVFIPASIVLLCDTRGTPKIRGDKGPCLRFYGPRRSRGPYRRKQGQYPAILTELAWSIKDLLYDIPRLLCCKLINILFSLFSLSLTFSVFSFSSSIPTEKSQKIFLLSRKIFCIRKPSCTAWASAKFYCESKTGNPEQAISLHLARSGSQSQRGIWFILPTHGASHITAKIIFSGPRVSRVRRVSRDACISTSLLFPPQYAQD